MNLFIQGALMPLDLDYPDLGSLFYIAEAIDSDDE